MRAWTYRISDNGLRSRSNCMETVRETWACMHVDVRVNVKPRSRRTLEGDVRLNLRHHLAAETCNFRPIFRTV
jgi:hypothetical protein